MSFAFQIGQFFSELISFCANRASDKQPVNALLRSVLPFLPLPGDAGPQAHVPKVTVLPNTLLLAVNLFSVFGVGGLLASCLTAKPTSDNLGVSPLLY